MTSKVLSSLELGGESSIKDFWILLKPRVMALVVFTAFCGIVLAPGTLHFYLKVLSIFCVAVGSGGAGVINMWYDRDIDRLMRRTSRRPLPQERINPGDALAFGMILSAGSVIILGLSVGWFPAGLLAFSIFFYTVIYTILLKRWTSQNIVIGGAAGAFPPLIGWACVTGSVSWESLWMFLIIFLWTPPHFWSLALCMIDEYKNVNVPMLPVVAGTKKTKNQIFIYGFLTIGVSLVGYFLGFHGKLYLLGASILGGVFFHHMIQILRNDRMKTYMNGFWYSIFYLFSLFVFMVLDRWIGV